MVSLDRLLSHISEHRVGTAERDDRHLAVKGGDRGEDVWQPEPDEEDGERAQPKQKAGGRDSEEAGERRPDMIGNAALENSVDDAREVLHCGVRSMRCRMTACRAVEQSCDRRGNDEDRKRNREEENGDKS